MDAFLKKELGLTQEHRQRRQTSTMTVEAHYCYRQEVLEGEQVYFTLRVLDGRLQQECCRGSVRCPSSTD